MGERIELNSLWRHLASGRVCKLTHYNAHSQRVELHLEPGHRDGILTSMVKATVDELRAEFVEVPHVEASDSAPESPGAQR